MAYALSQILVVSADSDLGRFPQTVAQYADILTLERYAAENGITREQVQETIVTARKDAFPKPRNSTPSAPPAPWPTPIPSPSLTFLPIFQKFNHSELALTPQSPLHPHPQATTQAPRKNYEKCPSNRPRGG